MPHRKITAYFVFTKMIGYFTGCSKLSGKLICGECGATYTRQARKLSHGERVYDWLCGRYINYGRKTENPYKRKNSQKAAVRLEDGCDNPNVKQEVVFRKYTNGKCEVSLPNQAPTPIQ